MDGNENAVISFAEFCLDSRRRALFRGEESIPITARAFDLLLFFAQNAGRVISKDEILDVVWKGQFVEEANLAVQVSTIRKALGDRTDDPRFLVTIPGKGYQFVAKIFRSQGAGSLSTGNDILSPSALTSKYVIFLIAAGMALSAIGYFVYRNYFVVSHTQVKSLAVLPFENETGDPNSAYLCDGLAESVIFSLSRLPDLQVMSRDSTFRYRGSNADAKRIGRELSVGGILTGRMLQVDDSISISTELISTENGSVIWGEQFTRRRSDIPKLQSDIARSISTQLGLKLTGADKARLDKQQTEREDVYDLYLLGRYHLNRLTDDGFLKGRDSFRQAIEKDPNYALGYAGLADSYNMLCGWGTMAPNDGYPLAKANALRALDLDEGLAEAHTALGVAKLFYDADWPGAERELGRAIELNPNYSDAHMMYGHAMMLRGTFAEARPHMARAAELDPRSIVKIVSVGNVSYFERDFATSLDVYRRAVDMDPNSGLAHWSAGNALLQLGKTGEAIAEYKKAIALSGDSPDEPASLALAYAIAGDSESARKILNELTERSRGSYVPRSLLAGTFYVIGEKDRAFELLEDAFRNRDSLLVYLKVDPIFDPMRSDQRFNALLSRVGLH